MEDLLRIESLFSADELLIRDNVKRFVDNTVLPHIENDFEKGIFRKELIPEIAALGLLGVTLPPQYGGGGAKAVAYGLICQELERGDSGLRSFVSVQNSLCMEPIHQFGTEEQKHRFLPLMAQGKLIGCFGLTEPEAGSDPNSMKTQAVPVQGGWKLNGAKMWITNAPIADLAIVFAKTPENVIQGFIVERGFKGFSTTPIEHKLSLRASSTGEIILQDCFVPEENHLPGTQKGLSTALHCLTQARFGIAFGVMGAAMACFDIALDYTKTRHQFGKPLASFQLIQADLVNMCNEIIKAQLLNLQLGRLKENNEVTFVMVSLAKMNACREALKIARMARNILGANGITLDYHVIRHMNNLESVFTYEGTDNVHHLIVGQHLTGINAFS